MKPEEYVQSSKHLPEPLRDFHDQKDLFKLMHRLYSNNNHFEKGADSVNWVTGQCYVIDWFLWFMAQRGYTLQKSRAKVDFKNLREEIEKMKEKDAEALRKALENRHVPPSREGSGSEKLGPVVT